MRAGAAQPCEAGSRLHVPGALARAAAPAPAPALWRRRPEMAAVAAGGSGSAAGAAPQQQQQQPPPPPPQQAAGGAAGSGSGEAGGGGAGAGAGSGGGAGPGGGGESWYLALLGLAEHFRTSSPPKVRLCVHCLQAVLPRKPPARMEARTHLQLGSVLYHHTRNGDQARGHLEKAVRAPEEAVREWGAGGGQEGGVLTGGGWRPLSTLPASLRGSRAALCPSQLVIWCPTEQGGQAVVWWAE